MSNTKFHKNFILNGRSFENVEELLTFSKTISKETVTFLNHWFDAKDVIEVQTSGSTGKPTTIQLKKEYMVNSALGTGSYFKLTENTKVLLCLSPNYIAGKMMLVRAMILGWHLDVVEPSSHPLKDIEKNYDFCAMVPMQLSNSLSQLHKIKKLIVGGGVVSNALLSKLQNTTTQVYATYGMTETITHIALKKLNNFDIQSDLNKGFDSAQPDIYVSSSLSTSLKTDPVERSQFKTLPNIKISTDNRGCLVINAPKVSDELVITNDLVELISETEFKWLGRFDNIINSGGIKLIPEQIEKKLALIIDKRFFVAGISDEMLGEKLVLVIEDGDSSNIISNKVKNLSTLDKFEVPKKIFFIKNFVETETKKIQRQQTLDLVFNK